MESMTYLYLCTKALIYGLFQKGRVLAQDGVADGDWAEGP